MMYEIAPHVMHNEFRIQKPKPSDFVIYTENARPLLKKKESSFCIPTVTDAEKVCSKISASLH